MLSTAKLLVPVLVVLLGTSLAHPAVEAEAHRCHPHTKCFDAVNSCGMKWGGCYDTCGPKPTQPACPPKPATEAPVTTIPPILPPVVTSVPISVGNCSTRTVCADYINSCGQMYGGCFPDCTPWPTFTPPPCSIIKTLPPTTLPTTTDCGTKCVDSINPCGQTYGGCFPACSPSPTFTPPPCSLTEVTTAVTITTSLPTTTACGTQCVDYINPCGQTYGGCFPVCSPSPTFTPPSCSLTMPTVTATTTK